MRRLLVVSLLLVASIALARPPQIGSLYTRDMSGSLNMTCTASVVSGTDLGLDFEAAILTAAHCVDRSIERDDVTGEYRSTADFLVTFDEREYFVVQLYRAGWQTKGYDVAVLYFPTRSPDIEPIRIGDWDEVTPGTSILNWANPMGLGLQRFTGYVTMLALDRPVENSSLNWRGNAVAMLPSAGGSSGSLILNEAGEVIGVLIGSIGAQRGAEFTVFVPLSKFDAFLNSDGAARSVSY